MFLDFYVVALYNLGFTICGSDIGQVSPPLPYKIEILQLQTDATKTERCAFGQTISQ